MRNSLRAIAIVQLAWATGCGPSSTAVQVGDVKYKFAASETKGVVQDQGHTFVRVKPINRAYQLILNTRTDREQQESGKPVISGVSDQIGGFEYIRTPAGTVVCKNVPKFGCGAELFDDKVRWSLVFHRADLIRVADFKADAAKLLASSRR